ncbi:hypothetical protein VPDG_00129 [Vibrio phage henriette 12B8]|uniref:hypothetical protein n=1 Tax=Vibrio phage henriette 12B8 TaxID=573174 RepID=UPI0002C154B8|nr:hypothetical protein VPDG_00129 [Vibrio phage henriette 12B8]AGG58290.1 hypothetical protein VPDG_00129 [Vibrio phage henriette 12B8]
MVAKKTKQLGMTDLFAMQTQVTQFPITEKPSEGTKEPKEIGFVYAKEFTSLDRSNIHKMIDGDDTRIPATYIMHSICDADGDMLFKAETEEETKEIFTKIRKMPDHIVGQMLAAVMTVNDMDEKKTAKN